MAGQGQLALVTSEVGFINNAIDAWFSGDVGFALEGGVQISLAYRSDKDANINRFSQSPLLSTLLKPLQEDPEQAWQNIQNANPEINLFQVFDETGNLSNSESICSLKLSGMAFSFSFGTATNSPEPFTSNPPS